MEAHQLNRKIRVRVSNYVLFSLIIIIFNISTTISSPSLISYRDHCNSIVPELNLSGSAEIDSYEFLNLRNSYYLGGNPIFDQASHSQSLYFTRSLSFRTNRLHQTTKDGVLQVEGSLVFRGTSVYSGFRNYTVREAKRSRFRTRKPRFTTWRGRVSFELKGFWSELDGKLCMVGSAVTHSREGNLLDLSAVFKANYPYNSSIFTSLVTGTVESLDSADSLNHFGAISLLAYSQRHYYHSLIERESGCSGVNGDEDRVGLGIGRSICSAFYGPFGGFELEYGSHCDSPKNCTSPLGGKFGFLPGFMSFSGVQCSETDNKKMRLLMGFSNTSFDGYYQRLDPSTTLIGEGVWDGEKNRLCVVACHILNYTESLLNATVGDCSVRMTLRFPAVLSIKSRSSIAGQIWSNKTMKKDSDHFDEIRFRSSADRMTGVPGLKYEYTELDRVRKLCAKKAVVGNRRNMYPNGYSVFDMRFDVTIKNSKRQHAWGYFTPLSVGDTFFEQSVGVAEVGMAPESPVQRKQNYSSVMNVSYAISFSLPVYFEFDGRRSSTNATSSLYIPVRILAEGVYDSGSGSLCMVGCRYLVSDLQRSSQNDSLDCEILINVQFPPLHAKKKAYVEGTIESTWKKSDLLHFERLEFSSTAMSTSDAVESIWRMDLEITMVLISNTLVCIFVALQLFYVKKHPDVLPSISLLMLVILTLGSMIPLVLNFEALFLSNHSRQNVLNGSGGWLEVNEVIVRVVTMVAFLLQVRLLQLTWSSRLGDGNHKGMWTAEKKALYVLLPLYLIGGLIAWIVLWWDNYFEAPLSNGILVATKESRSLLGDLRSYAGLLLDGFLLPQILVNVFWSAKDKIFSPAFYVGITTVRLLPHAYDLYRAHGYATYYNASYFYANPRGDFFSTAWDVIILCGGLLFAVLIYVQQRFGGRCILPRSLRDFDVYEKVPVVTGE